MNIERQRYVVLYFLSFKVLQMIPWGASVGIVNRLGKA